MRFRKYFSCLLTLVFASQLLLPVFATETESIIPQETPEEAVIQEIPQSPVEENQCTFPPETVPETVPETTPETVSETIPEKTVTLEIPEETVEGPEEYEEYEDPEYLKIPLFFQTDYPDTLYGAGTIATSGCSITSLAMVATYMTGHTYYPDELAYYFGGSAENNMKRLENGAEALQLPFHKAENWHETLGELHNGKVAIALMDMNSKFTTSQHFIVLTGINSDGKIMVNDPMESNYSKWDLEDGLVYGFEEYEIVQGYSGAWIFDKSAMPENPYIYSEEMPQIDNARYPHIQLTPDEEDLLARVIWVEARGECDEGQQAVAEVVLNRLASSDFPDTLKDVIFASGQFRSVEFLKDAEPCQAQYMAIEKAMFGPYILPKEVVHFATYKATDYCWGQIGGHYFCYDWNYSGG